jgi:hypothetical protein
VIAQQRIVNLPLNNRNFLQLAIMTPGVRIKEESNGERTRVVANGNRYIWMQVNITPGPGPAQERRPYPDFAAIRMMVSDGNGLYHSLQTRYEHRLTKGLNMTAAYT